MKNVNQNWVWELLIVSCPVPSYSHICDFWKWVLMSFTSVCLCLVEKFIDHLLPCWISIVALTLFALGPLQSLEPRAETHAEVRAVTRFGFGDVRLSMDLAFILLIYGSVCVCLCACLSLSVCVMFPRQCVGGCGIEVCSNLYTVIWIVSCWIFRGVRVQGMVVMKATTRLVKDPKINR